VQVPALPWSAHERQVPVQVVPQQTPCSQLPELHSDFAPHIAPSGLSPQLIAVHTLPVVQSALVLQVVRQLPPVPHTNGLQVCMVPAPHVPAPSQRPASVAVEPVQVGMMHWVPLACSRHLPAPSQAPSVPQLAVPMSVHWLSGSDPLGMNEQVPTLPARLQAWHRAEQPVEQQTPCSQKLEAQSAACVHAAPGPSLPQMVPVQTLPGAQSVLVAHFVRQVPAVPHTYGKQFCRPGDMHVPSAAHCPGSVSVEPAQVGCMHTVPTAYLRQAPAPSQVPSVSQAPGPPSAH
jgi:hypothetical protein